MRAAFTIIFNGKHHLLHNNYVEMMTKHLDYWVFVEGASNNTGSTSWCKKIPKEYHNNGRSVDGTLEYLEDLEKSHKNVRVISRTGFWNNKDEQCNTGLMILQSLVFTPKRNKNEHVFLWQIDCDEQWDPKSMTNAEQSLTSNKAKTGMFLPHHYVGKNLLARGGSWGESPFVRLWDWNGQLLSTHEPPKLVSGNEPRVLLPQRFNHYSYYFEQDVKFKDAWYGGHEGVYERWKKLQLENVFPRPIGELLPLYAKTNSKIVKI